MIPQADDFDALLARIVPRLGEPAETTGHPRAVWTGEDGEHGVLLDRLPLPGVDGEAWILAAVWGASQIDCVHAFPLALGDPEPRRFTPEAAAEAVAARLGWGAPAAPVVALPLARTPEVSRAE